MEAKRIFIGIDFSKSYFDVAIHQGNHGVFSNEEDGYQALFSWLSEELGEVLPEDVLFCGENTGNYSLGLCNHLYCHGFHTWLENPLQIKLSMGLTRGKNDKADAYAIARYAARNFMDAVAYEPQCDNMSYLRELFSSRRLLVSMRTSVTNHLKSLQVSHRASKRGEDFNSKTLAQEQESLTQRIKEVEKEIIEVINADEDFNRNYKHITSIKGVGPVNAAALIIVTNNFREFSLNPRKLACHIGVAPFVHESGTSVRKGNHVSRMSNHLIKPLLTQAAMSAIRYNDYLTQYYQRIRKKGKNFQVSLNNVKNKLLHIIIGLIRKDEDYEQYYYLNRK